LEAIDQLPIGFQFSQRGDKTLPRQTEGLIHQGMGCAKKDKAKGRTLFLYHSMGKGITESPPLKIDVGSNDPFQAIPSPSFFREARPFRSQKISFQLSS
jgi:hypothetical protein